MTDYYKYRQAGKKNSGTVPVFVKYTAIFLMIAVFVFSNKEAQAATTQPTWKASSAIAASTGANITVILPTHAADDIFLLQVLLRSTADTITVPADWTQIATIDRGTTSRYWWFWKRAVSSTETNPVISTSTGFYDIYAVVTTYQNAIKTGDPWEVKGTPNTTTIVDHFLNGITTLTTDSLIVASLCGENNSAASIAYSSPLVQKLFVSTGTGSNAACAVGTGGQAVIGATGNVTATWSATVVGSGGILLALQPTTTTLADGANPSSVTIGPGGNITDLDAFTLVTDTGTDTVTALTVTLTGANSFESLSEVRITSNDNLTTYFSAVAPTSNTVSFSGGTSILVNATATTFKVRITPKTHVNMPAPPGLSYAVGGTVTAFTSSGTKCQVNTDTASGTVVVDNQSPSNATTLSTIPATNSITVRWANPAGDFNKVVIVRRQGTSNDGTPTEGTTYLVGNPVGSGTVVYVGAGAGAGAISTYTDSSLSSSTKYYYKIWVYDAFTNYASGGVEVDGTTTSSSTGDITPPAPSTLNVNTTYTRGFRLTWTAPGDDGSTGQASAYDFRFTDAMDYLTPMTAINGYLDTNWVDPSKVTQAEGEPLPHAAGTTEYFNMTYDINGNKMKPNTLYYIAMKTADKVPNYSGISNVISGHTAMKYGYNMLGLPYSPAGGSTFTALFSDNMVPITNPVYVMKWDSNGLDVGGAPQGQWTYVDSATVPNKGAGYWLYAYCMNCSVLDDQLSDNANGASVIVPLEKGWNDISNPYLKNVLVSNTYLCKSVGGTVTGFTSPNCTGTGAITTNTFASAVAAGWTNNAVYYYANSSTWDYETYDGTGGKPVANLRPWWGQRIYNNAADAPNYTQGTGTISTSGAAVTGVGTSFNTDIAVGNMINVGGQVRVVTAIGSATSLTVGNAFSPDLPAGTLYTYSADTTSYFIVIIQP